MHGLVATLNKCEGHFIRCIKPNGAWLPTPRFRVRVRVGARPLAPAIRTHAPDLPSTSPPPHPTPTTPTPTLSRRAAAVRV